MEHSGDEKDGTRESNREKKSNGRRTNSRANAKGHIVVVKIFLFLPREEFQTLIRCTFKYSIITLNPTLFSFILLMI